MIRVKDFKPCENYSHGVCHMEEPVLLADTPSEERSESVRSAMEARMRQDKLALTLARGLNGKAETIKDEHGTILRKPLISQTLADGLVSELFKEDSPKEITPNEAGIYIGKEVFAACGRKYPKKEAA